MDRATRAHAPALRCTAPRRRRAGFAAVEPPVTQVSSRPAPCAV